MKGSLHYKSESNSACLQRRIRSRSTSDSRLYTSIRPDLAGVLVTNEYVRTIFMCEIKKYASLSETKRTRILKTSVERTEGTPKNAIL